MRRRAITLVELLVVIGIIAILVMLLLPAVQQVRESARRTQCTNNLRQTGIAIRMHESSQGTFPAGWSANTVSESGWGWATVILPYLEQQYSVTTAAAVDDDSGKAGNDKGSPGKPEGSGRKTLKGGPPPWAGGKPPWAGGPPIEAPVNKTFREMPISVYLCPSDPSPEVFTLYARGGGGDAGGQAGQPGNADRPQRAGPGPPMFKVARANYAGVFGTMVIEDSPSRGDGAFYHNSFLRSANIRDGLGNTIFVGERSSRLGSSTWVGSVAGAQRAMARVVGRTGRVPNDVLGYFEDFSSHHVTGAHFLFGDGNVRLLSDAIDLDVYRALATRAGGEMVDPGNLTQGGVHDATPLAEASPAPR